MDRLRREEHGWQGVGIKFPIIPCPPPHSPPVLPQEGARAWVTSCIAPVVQVAPRSLLSKATCQFIVLSRGYTTRLTRCAMRHWSLGSGGQRGHDCLPAPQHASASSACVSILLSRASSSVFLLVVPGTEPGALFTLAHGVLSYQVPLSILLTNQSLKCSPSNFVPLQTGSSL